MAIPWWSVGVVFLAASLALAAVRLENDGPAKRITLYGSDWSSVYNGGQDNGTTSLSGDQEAYYTFNFSGTGFTIYADRSQERGRFLVDIDGTYRGGGDAFSTKPEADLPLPAGAINVPASLYDISGLEEAMHYITVYSDRDDTRCTNATHSICKLVLDYVQYEDTKTTTEVATSSAVYPSTADFVNGVTDVQSDTTSSSEQLSPTDTSMEDQDGHQDSGGGMSNGAIAGAAVGGALGTLLVVFIILGVLWKWKLGPFKVRLHKSDVDLEGPRSYDTEEPESHLDAHTGAQPPSYEMATPQGRQSVAVGTSLTEDTDSSAVSGISGGASYAVSRRHQITADKNASSPFASELSSSHGAKGAFADHDRAGSSAGHQTSPNKGAFVDS